MNYYSGMMVDKDRVKEVKILGLGETFESKYKSAFKRHFSGLKTLILRENVLRVIVSLLATLASCFLFGTSFADGETSAAAKLPLRRVIERARQP